MPFVKPSEIPEYMSMLFFAQNGAGKTTLLASLKDVPEMLPAVIIDADGGGCVTLKHIPGTEVLDVFSFDKTKSTQVQIPEIVNGVRSKQFKTVVLDSGSEFMERIIHELSGGSRPTFAHWNALFRITKSFVADLKKLSTYFISTAYPRYEKNSDGDVIGIFPSLSGQEFPKFFNNMHHIIAMMRTETEKNARGIKVTRILSAIPFGAETVRDRFDRIGTIVDPTMRKIYDKIGGGMAKVPQ